MTYKLNTEVTSIDLKEKTVSTKTNEVHQFEKILVATGARAANPLASKLDPSSCKNLHLLRSEADAARLVGALEDSQGKKEKEIVIIGGGYIGTEVAAGVAGWAQQGLVKSVTIVNMDPTLMHRVFAAGGSAAAAVVPEFLEKMMVENSKSNGEPVIKVFNGARIADIATNAADEIVSSVKLASGETLACDLCVLATGATPNTEILETCGVKFGPRKHVQVDSGSLQLLDATSGEAIDGAFAAGDCITRTVGADLEVVEHVGHARSSGKHAAMGMMGENATRISIRKKVRREGNDVTYLIPLRSRQCYL